MNEIMAFLDGSPSDASVQQVAETVGLLFDSSVRPVSIPSLGHTQTSGTVAEALLGELTEREPLLAVLGTRSNESKPEPVGHVASEILSNSSVPLILVPPSSKGLGSTRPRILVPLDAAGETDDALGPILEALTSAGAELLTLHVFDSESVPPFIGSSHDLDALAKEFLHSHVPGCSNRCELRIGDPAQHVIETARSESVDAIVVAWKQDLAPGRADVVRRLLGEAKVPLLIVPIGLD